MRFYVEALRHVLTPKPPFGLPVKLAAGGAALAALVVIYGAVSGDDIPADADAVAVSGAVFTPVAMTPPVPAPAFKPSATGGAPTVPRFDDERSLTRAVQAELKRAQCYSGPVNGIWTASTRAAMGEFAGRVNARLPVDRADPVLLALLETHNKISCTEDCTTGGEPGCVPRGARPAQRAEIAAAGEEPPAEERMPSPGAADLGFSTDQRRAPNPIASVQSASAEPEEANASEDAALAAAAATATVAPAPRLVTPERRRAARKVRKQPSLSRQVSKGFRQIQRTLNKLF